MRPCTHFSVLHRAITGRLTRLRSVAVVASNRPLSEFSRANLEMSFVTVELHTAIANFLRAYFLSCILHPFTMGGRAVSCHPSVGNFRDAIDASMKACKNSVWAKAGGKKIWSRREEPSWHQPESLIKSCSEIGCSHQHDIVAAFSVPTRVFGDLTKFRNFYAHRNEETITSARSLGLAYGIYSGHPSQILAAFAYSRPQPLILDWIDDTQNTIGLLCQ